jgi:hypothetical protein
MTKRAAFEDLNFLENCLGPVRMKNFRNMFQKSSKFFSFSSISLYMFQSIFIDLQMYKKLYRKIYYT